MNVQARKNPLKFILVKGLWYEQEKIVYSNFNLNFFHLFFVAVLWNGRISDQDS